MQKWLIIGALVLAACSGDSAPTQADDAGQTTEAVDMGAEDAAVSDTANEPDAAVEPDMAQGLPDVGEAPDMDVVVPDVAMPDVGAPDVGGPTTIAELCFGDRLPMAGDFDGPDYDQFSPNVGAHCLGTNHQHIYGIEEVVFLGDSVTVGSPPTLSQDFYRAELAQMLAAKFNLQAPEYLWQVYDPFNGTASQMQSGNFKSCAKWGARTDDFLKGGDQIAKCFPDGGSDKRTLIVFTMGGNDVFKITESGAPGGGSSFAEVQQMTEQAVADLEEAMQWLTDPQRFPNGSFVVFANPYEYTDATGNTDSCPAAPLAGIEEWDNPADLAELVVWMNEQFMRVAVETGTDMIFMLEEFCGHGWAATGSNADTSSRCYLGPNTERWFDDTCIHPNAPGHGTIAQMFMQVIEEIGTPPSP